MVRKFKRGPNQPDISGEKHNRLTLLKREKSENGKIRYLCLCECGTIKSIDKYKIVTGETKSCGCLQRESIVKKLTRHGMSGSRVYEIWCGIVKRCKPNGVYGKRGITVCKRWLSFENFLRDMGQPPSTKHSIDRINNNEGYEPKNCRWATYKEQANNTSANRWLTIDGIKLTQQQASEKYGIKSGTIYNRINKLGWTEDQAVKTPKYGKYGNR